MLDVITATSPVILNCLIDMRGIESILIIKVSGGLRSMTTDAVVTMVTLIRSGNLLCAVSGVKILQRFQSSVSIVTSSG